MKTRRPLDRMFLITAGVLILVGFLIFSSASLGLLAKDGNSYSSIVFNQLVLGLGLGGFLLFITSQIPYTFWRKYSLYIFIAALFVFELPTSRIVL
jgi:cell division protein FtsW (lipid II flippase)